MQPRRLTWQQIGDPNANPGFPYVRALDEQVALARAQNPPIGVVIQSYCFPAWANGTAGMGDSDTAADRVYDRVPRDANGQLLRHLRKPRYFGIPVNELGADQAWGRWVVHLIMRYAQYGCGVMLDLLNEPNLQWWPQTAPSTSGDPWAPGTPAVGCHAANMMNTAQNISNYLGRPIPIAAPGTSDLGGPSPTFRRWQTAYTGFVTDVLNNLDAVNFTAIPQFMWTHHNYEDVRTNPAALRAVEVRRRLTGRWAGWRGERQDVPNIWITEGGARLDEPEATPQSQAAKIQANWQRHGGATGDGAGFEMWTNYLYYSVPSYDTGLRNPAASGGGLRQAHGTFAAWPGR